MARAIAPRWPASRASASTAPTSHRSWSQASTIWLIMPASPKRWPSSGEKIVTPASRSRAISSGTMTPPPPPKILTWPAPSSRRDSARYSKNSTCPPWYELTATPWTSSSSTAATISLTARLWPRCTTSAPCDCRMRRMMLMLASCPSNSADDVTKRTGWLGLIQTRALSIGDTIVGLPTILARLGGHDDHSRGSPSTRSNAPASCGANASATTHPCDSPRRSCGCSSSCSRRSMPP